MPREHQAVAVSVACGVAAGALRVTPIFDPDYHWHLHTGRWIAEHRAVPAVDPFSHTFAGQPWKFVDWLADLILYGLHRLGGDGLVVVAFALVGGLAVGLSLEVARRAVPSASFGAQLCVGLLVAAAVVFRITPRPQTLTLALFAIELLLLERARTSERALYALPLLIVVWQNLHGSALVGWLVLFAFAVGRRIESRKTRASVRTTWVVTALSFVAIFVAVRPWSRFLAAFDHIGDPRVGILFTEWASVHSLRAFHGAVAALAILVLLALAGIATKEGRDETPVDRVLVAGGTLLLAERTLRLVPFAAIALCPLALAGLSRVTLAIRHALVRAVPLLVGVAVALALLFVQKKPLGLGLDRSLFPEGSAAFLARARPSGPMYNDFHFGGYLLFSLRDAYPVFIDGRSMAVYGIDFVYTVLSADEAHIGPLLDRYRVAFVVAPSGKRIDWFQRRPGWTIAYFDDVSFVAIRDEAQPSEVRALGYKAIHPASYWEDVASLAEDPSKIPAAIVEAERAIVEAPNDSMPHVARAAVAMGAGDGARADLEIEAALRLRPDAVRGHRIKAMRCVELHDRACACREAATVLRLAPTNAYAKTVAFALACETQ